MNGSTEQTSLPPKHDESDVCPIVVDRQLLEELFSDLYENRIIYHERITILSEVERVEITDSELDVWHRPIRLLYKPDHWFVDGMYERWISVAPLRCGAVLGNKDFLYKYHCNGRLSAPYIPFLLWPHKDLVKKISSMTDEELKTDLQRVLGENRR